MEISMIRHLAGTYRLFPDKRPQILREIYKAEGKTGVQAFVRVLGNKSAELFVKWVKEDFNITKRCRRGQKLIRIGNPPGPPGNGEYNFKHLFEDMPVLMGGYKLGRQGGKRNVSSVQAWDAKNGGGK